MTISKLFASQFLGVLLFLGLIVTTNQFAFSQYVCQISGAPIMQSGSLADTDPTQTGRVVRDGVPSSCRGKTNGLQNTTAVNFDSYNFVAPITGCATVDFDATACGGATTQAVAYSSFNPATPAVNVIGDFGFSTTGVARFSFPVTSGVGYTIVVHDIIESPTNVFCTSYSFKITYRTGCRQPGFDKSNDGKADPTVFRPSDGSWNVLNSAGGTSSLLFGQSGDIPTAGDYTGDGQTDLSVYRPSSSTWFYATSQATPATNIASAPWGAAGDVPVPGDYDADGKTDIAVWRPSDGTWYVLNSATNSVSYVRWGRNGDVPVVGDYDGDLKTDFVVMRPDEAGVAPDYNWYLLQSNFNFGFGLFRRWGTVGDRVVSGDFDGNGKADIAVFRPSNGTWYFIQSTAQNATGPNTGAFRWGQSGDIPQPADYDGDGLTDFAVFRPSLGQWFISNSNNGAYNTFSAPVWGTSTDQPTTSAYLVTNP